MYHIPKRKTMHFVHFIVTVLTGGLWILPWILFTLYNNSYNQKIDIAMMQNEDRRSQEQRRNRQRSDCTCLEKPDDFCEACGN